MSSQAERSRLTRRFARSARELASKRIYTSGAER